MILYDKSVILSSSLNNTIINSFAPCNLTINPSTLVYSKKIYKIKYFINDSLLLSQKYFYSNTNNFNLPFPTEEGDPRNYPYNTILSLTSSIKQDFKIKADVYTFANSLPNTINFTLSLSAPKMDGTTTSYFSSVHLLYTRIFGVDNNILYVFESKNPNYYIPIVINWKLKPIEVETVKIESKTRSYQLLSNFQDEKEENKHINKISYD